MIAELSITAALAAAFGYAVGSDLKQPQFQCEHCGVYNRDEDAATTKCYRCGGDSPEHDWVSE